jgi:membrane protease YdiL (CAAX protease family)
MFADSPEQPVPPSFNAPRRIWRGRDIGAGFALLTVGVLSIGIVLAVTNRAVPFGESRYGDTVLLIAALVQQLILGGAVLLLAARRGISFQVLGFVRPQRWNVLTTAWLGAYGIFIAYGVALLLIERLGFDVAAFRGTNPLPIEPGMPVAHLAMLGLMAVILAPLTEELFFRGLVYRGLRGIWRRLPALVASGICFGLLHLEPGVFVPFSLVGVLWAWSNDQSGSIWTSMIAHALVNGLSFTLALAGVAE